MSMDSCETHGWWEVDGQGECPRCEITCLLTEIERLKFEVAKGFKDVTNDPAMLAENGRLKGELEAAHGVVSNIKRLLEDVVRERDEALVQVAMIREQVVQRLGLSFAPHRRGNILDNFLQWFDGEFPTEARTLLDRLHELEKEPVITLPDGRNVSIGELVELYLEQSDRLQRAEAALKAGVKHAEGLCGCFRPPDSPRPCEWYSLQAKALAAWEGGGKA